MPAEQDCSSAMLQSTEWLWHANMEGSSIGIVNCRTSQSIPLTA
jgi:hypothetical protein